MSRLILLVSLVPVSQYRVCTDVNIKPGMTSAAMCLLKMPSSRNGFRSRVRVIVTRTIVHTVDRLHIPYD